MVWIFLELLTALLLAIFIVWFTMTPKRKTPPQESDATAVGTTSRDNER